MTMHVGTLMFWTLVAMLAWPAIAYPIILAIRGRRRRAEIVSAVAPPASATVVITVAGEAWRLREKLRNTLDDVCWGETEIDVILVFDGDRNGAPGDLDVERNPRTLQFISFPRPRGKHACQRAAIRLARGEVIVFTDIATHLDAESGARLLKAFADPAVGCASGVDQLGERGSGEGSYVQIEMQLRALESRAGGLVGASGCFFAARRSICKEWTGHSTSDFAIPVIARMRGLRAVSVADATCSYSAVRTPSREFQRKVRTIVHGIQVLAEQRTALNPWRNGFLSLQLVSRKLLRWTAPPILLALCIIGASLHGLHSWYAAPAIAMGATIAAGLLGFATDGLVGRLLRPFSYAVLVMCATVAAWCAFAGGARYETWKPSGAAARANAEFRSERRPSGTRFL